MEYKGEEQPSLKNAEQLLSQEPSAVPPSLLPSVLSRLGLGDITSFSFTGADKQLAALKDEEVSVRVAAVRSLGEQREASALEPLQAALRDPAWEVRAAAVWALAQYGEQAPLAALLLATDDEDGSVRGAALRTLGSRGERVSREPLLRALNDANWQVREIATFTVGDYGEPAPLEPLVARLNDEHAAVREAARMALEQSHPEVLSTIRSDSIVTQQSATEMVSSARAHEQPRTDGEGETTGKGLSHGGSPLMQLTVHMSMLLSRVRRDVVPPRAQKRVAFADEEVSTESVSEPREREVPLPPPPTKPRRLKPLADAVLAALLMAGIVASWLVIQQRLHPSPGSASPPLLVYHGHVAGPAVWSFDSQYISMLTETSPAGETVLVWNRATGQVTKHRLHAVGVTPQENSTVFAPDGTHLAFIERITNNQEVVQVWDILAWRRILTAYYTSPAGFLDVLWSPNSARLVIPGPGGVETMQVWNVVTGHELVACHVPLVDYLPDSSSLSPDGQRVLFGGPGPQNMYVLDLTTCKLVTLASTDANAIVWSPQGNRFATVSLTDARVVQVWDAATGRNLASFHLTAPMSEILWTPDGTRIVASGEKEVDVLEVVTHAIVLQVIPTSIDLLPVWALSPDGKRLASLRGADRIQIWDTATGHKLSAYQSPEKTVKVVVWSPDSATVATGGGDGTVRVWIADTAAETYHSDASGVLNLVWSPDGKSLASGAFDGSIWVWKVNKSSI